MIKLQTTSLAANGPNKLITEGPKSCITPMQIGGTIISINIDNAYTIDLGQTVKYKGNIPYKINGLHLLQRYQKLNKGVLLFFKHSLHLELDSRILAINAEIYGVERKHNSTYFESIQKNDA